MGTLPNSFYEANVTMLPKSDKENRKQKTKNYRPIFFMNTNSKIVNKILASRFQQYMEIIIHNDAVILL